MAKAKFTPFVLFLILLVVLVISVLFGYKNKIFEGATTYKSGSYKKIATLNGKDISVNKSSGNILIKDVSGSSAIIIDSTGNPEDAKEGHTTMSNMQDDVSSFVYEDGNVIIPYINYAKNIYLMIIDPVKNQVQCSYIYAKGKDKLDDSIGGYDIVFKNISSVPSGKSSGNIVSMSSDIEIDVDKKKFKQGGEWKSIRTNTPSKPQIIKSKDGSFVISMEGTSSTSNYVVFSLYKKDGVINMDPVIIKDDSSYSKEESTNSKSGEDMSKYVPKTWLNPNGCPKCTSSGNCSSCGTSGPKGTPGSSSVTAGPGTGSTTPGTNPAFGNNLVDKTAGVGNNLVDKTAGVANSAVGGATALGLGAELGATVLGASALGAASNVGVAGIGGATSLGNNLAGGATNLGNSAIGGATNLGNSAANLAGGALGKTGDVLNNTIGTAGGVVNNTVDKLTGLAAGLGTGTKDLLQSGQMRMGANGQPIQGDGQDGQYTPNGQLIVQQPNGQQYSGYQFAFPVTNYGSPIVSPVIQTSNFTPFSDQIGVAGRSKGGNYVG